MMNGIEYIDYDKISDDLCWLGNKCIVRMVVKLANKNKEGNRNHFHKEYKYPTSYNDKREAITIRRSFDYYISIDNLDSKDSILITVRDILLLRAQLSQVFNWFYDKTFALKNNKMIILEKKKPIMVDGLMGGKYLMFEPIVYTDWEEKQSKGIRITLGNPDAFTDVPVNVFAGFMYLMNSIDMYSAAQGLINYIGHPDFGTNLLAFEKSEYVSGEQQVNNTIKNRTIESKKQYKSFFDMD
jgi:hypothetical protein